MAANTDPIYSRSPDIQWTTIPSATTANTAGDGTGTVFTVWTSDSTNGGFLQRVRIKALSTSTATVLRFFINNGSTNGTAANNSFFEEVTIPAVTASSVAAVQPFEVPFNVALPAGYKVNCCYATSVTGAVYLTAIGGKY
jgi:hypothetical protein